MIAVKLTDAEFLFARMIGNARTAISRSGRIVDCKMGPQDGIYSDEEGAIGEFAFCKHFNLFMDTTMIPRSGTYDCKWLGYRVDIKTTHYQSGKLMARRKNPDVDLYVLAIWDEPNRLVKFPGFATAEQLYNGHQEEKGGFSLRQNQLTPFVSVDNIIELANAGGRP